MIYQLLIDQIRTESRVEGDSNFIPTCISLINELFKEAVGSQNPFELRNEETLPLTTNVDTVALPADFFIHKQVLFNDADTGKRYNLVNQDSAIPPAPRGLFGHPKSFEIAGANILLKPATGIVTGDSLLLVYYKKPPEISQANLIQSNPIPRLEPFLVRGAVQRIRMLHAEDPAMVQALTGMVGSAGKAYSNDEPRRNS